MTEKIYDTDSYRKEFEATVIDCEPAGAGYKVILNRTAFFPEGGGQAADTGVLDGAEVTDVQIEGDTIYHIVSGPLEIGQTVKGELNWKQRFDRMQQHSGEHIVSGLIHDRFGYDNVGFHLGDEGCTLDLNGPMTREELSEIEAAANEVVFDNRRIFAGFPTKEELKELDYRSKIEIDGQVRIVTVEGCDVCACCAPHVSRTGEIGLIKFVHSQNYKGGVRITMAAGGRALKDYIEKEKNVKAIMASLSAKEDKIAEAVEHLKAENSELKGKLVDANSQILACKVQNIPEGAERICLFEKALEGSAPRELMNLVLGKGVGICGVFTQNGSDGYRYVIGSKRIDVRPISKALNNALEGRGGGKPEMVQGSLKGSRAQIQEIFEGVISQ